MKLWRTFAVEIMIWSGALIILAMTEPSGSHLVTFCPVSLAGFSWCPGCGLGRSIAYALHGDIASSVQMHWLGIPVLVFLIRRIAQLGFSLYQVRQ
jgi:hypothetical protein